MGQVVDRGFEMKHAARTKYSCSVPAGDLMATGASHRIAGRAMPRRAPITVEVVAAPTIVVNG